MPTKINQLTLIYVDIPCDSFFQTEFEFWFCGLISQDQIWTTLGIVYWTSQQFVRKQKNRKM